jgi:hypothetical protein
MNHDALAYHLPRALAIVRDHGYGIVDSLDARLTWPANYELLTADIILLDGSDRATALIPIAAYVFMLIVIAAIAQRWWGRGMHVLTAVLLVGGTPVMLVHAGAHKNDVLAWALFLASMLFAGRWCVDARRPPWILASVSVALAIGTKMHAAMLVASLAPLLAWHLWAHWRAGMPLRVRQVVAAGAFALGVTLLLGGEVFVTNLIRIGRPVALTRDTATFVAWSHLWQLPFVLVAAPFSSRFPGAVWCPWTHSYWFHPTYDLFFSTFGGAVSILLAFLPLCIWRYAGHADNGLTAGLARDSRRTERMVTTTSVLASSALIMLVPLKPPFFVGSPRYVLGLAPIIVLWSVGPVSRVLSSRPFPGRAVPPALLVAATAIFVYTAIEAARLDPYQPLAFVLDVDTHPQLSRRIYNFPGRAASIVDELAKPDDSIAIDGEFDTWVYPAYGRELRRRVAFLHSERTPLLIPADARWVIIDRAWRCWFGHPAFTDLGQWWNYIGQGKPAPEDLVVFRALRQDPRFQLRYRNRQFNQAVFERIGL